MRLFRTLLLLMMVASVVPTAIVGWTSLSDTRTVLVHDAQNLARERARGVSLRLQSILESGARATEALAGTPRLVDLPLAEQQLNLRALLQQRRQIVSAAILDVRAEPLQGLHQADAELPATELEHQLDRARTLAKQPSPRPRFSPVHLPSDGGPATVTLVREIGKPVRAYLAAELSLDEVSAQLQRDRLTPGELMLVVNAEGRVVASNATDASLRAGHSVQNRPSVRAALAKAPAQSPATPPGPAETSAQVGNFGEGDDQVVAAWTSIPELGWSVVYEQPVDAAYLPVREMERRLGFSVLGALSVAMLLAALFARHITRPLKGFIAGAMELASGKFGTQVKVVGKNELSELAQTFNYMSMQMMASNAEMQGLYDSLEKGYLETIVALANSIDSKDAYTRGHSQRVGDLSVEIGTELGLTRRELRLLHYGGILHDVGKIGIGDAILCKQTRLTDEEMVVMREHPVIGGNIVDAVSFLAPVRAAVRNHHERWDGTGYPDKLKGEEIPLIARIVNCADTFDACTSTRPYQKAMPLEKAMEILENLRGTQLDPNVLDALRRVLQKKGVRLEGSRQPVKLAS